MAGWNADDTSFNLKSDAQWAAELAARGIPPEQIAAYQAEQARYVREGGELPGQPPWMAGPQPVRIRTGDLPTGDMHNPGWGIERPDYRTGTSAGGLGALETGTPGGPLAPLPPAQSGTFPGPSWGTLGGAAGMGQPMSLYERGGGQSAYGGGPQAGGPYGMAPGGIGSSIGRQSPTPYGMGRQSPTPYGMGRASPTPYSGSGYSTLGGMSGYGRRY